MRLVFKVLLLLQLVLTFLSAQGPSQVEIIVLLLVIGLNVCRERVYDSTWLLVLELGVVSVAVYWGIPMGLWYGALAYDFAFRQLYLGLAAIASCVYAFALYDGYTVLPLVLAFAVLFAYAVRKMDVQREEQQGNLDQERRLRYSLEDAKRRLLRSQEEIAHITEVKERNRIAREIHDNVGHSIAGILMQMQVAMQFVERDSGRAKLAIDKCLVKLTETLDVLRDTVHNMRPAERLGLEYLKAVIEDFAYCPIEFEHSGDFSTLPSPFIESMNAIIKESLTNSSRYSSASKVWLKADVNDKYVRLQIKDNGVGCGRISEGLGLSSMRERVANLGGTITINGDNGFLIVCILYRRGEFGGS